MRCQRCGFENVPGLTTCVRCRSVLTVVGPMAVTPPRAGWTKPFRPVAYWLNRHLGFHITAAVEEPLRDLLGGILSLLPGLDHLLRGRLRQIRWLWLAWLGTLTLGITFRGSIPGSMLVGLAAGVHTLIMADAARLRRHCSTLLRRIVAVLILFVLLLGVLYVAGLRLMPAPRIIWAPIRL